MKKLFFSLLIILFTLPCFAKEDLDSSILKISSDIQKPLDKGDIICILDFSSSSKNMSEYIQSELTSKVMEDGSVRVVTRAHMDKVNTELNYQMSGFVSDETALSICQRLGAQAIVFGQLKELDNKYNLQVKMLDVETGSYIMFKTYEFNRSSKSEQLLGRAAIYYKTAIGLSAEVNKNSMENLAFGGAVSFDYTILRKAAVGAKVFASYDPFEKSNSIITIEPLGTLRVYAVSPSGEPATGLFVEAQAGISLFFVNSDFNNCINAGAELGYRFGIGNFYAEPYLRGGYPYLLGGGINLGMRF